MILLIDYWDGISHLGVYQESEQVLDALQFLDVLLVGLLGEVLVGGFGRDVDSVELVSEGVQFGFDLGKEGLLLGCLVESECFGGHSPEMAE